MPPADRRVRRVSSNGRSVLPPELLPRPWPGRTARDIVVRSRRLALLLRVDARRPALFSLFDDAVRAVR